MGNVQKLAKYCKEPPDLLAAFGDLTLETGRRAQARRGLPMASREPLGIVDAPPPGVGLESTFRAAAPGSRYGAGSAMTWLLTAGLAGAVGSRPAPPTPGAAGSSPPPTGPRRLSRRPATRPVRSGLPSDMRERGRRRPRGLSSRIPG